jgi:ABC-2 type transport system ATP-binding protein
MPGEPVIQVGKLFKNYGDKAVLKGISFEVRRGEILGFLGPNGAGKSTTMKILTGYISATAGQVTIDGVDLFTNPLEARRRIGYLPESTPLYTDMVVYDYLDYVGDIRGVGKAERARKIADVAKVVGIKEVIGSIIGTLSKGYKQRVGLAQAMIHDPQILILDEPTSGLDPNQIVEVRNLIKHIGAERTVILSTHNLPEVRQTCDRMLIIHRGDIVADGTPSELEARHTAAPAIVLTLAPKDGTAAPAIAGSLGALAGVKSATLSHESHDGGRALTFQIETTFDVRGSLFDWAKESGHTLLELKRDALDLEGIFRRLTQDI